MIKLANNKLNVLTVSKKDFKAILSKASIL